jgi:protoheme ferro-lyase
MQNLIKLLITSIIVISFLPAKSSGSSKKLINRLEKKVSLMKKLRKKISKIKKYGKDVRKKF